MDNVSISIDLRKTHPCVVVNFHYVMQGSVPRSHTVEVKRFSVSKNVWTREPLQPDCGPFHTRHPPLDNASRAPVVLYPQNACKSIIHRLRPTGVVQP